MKNLIASHTDNIYLKPGEVFISKGPTLVSTVLGSCVAVTLFSPARRCGAICHAMLPENIGTENDLRYVDAALQHIYAQLVRRGNITDLVVKLFGGAKVLDVGEVSSSRLTIGDQNILKAEEILAELGFTISARDTGGLRGRKLFFCTRSGDVYLRRMRGRHIMNEGLTL